MWDSGTLQCMKTLEGHEDNVRVLAVGDQQVFSGSWDKTIRVWDLETLECSKVSLALGSMHSAWWHHGDGHGACIVCQTR